MSQPPCRRLGPADRRLLVVAAWFVPLHERADWTRSWTGELWHSRHRNHRLKQGPFSSELCSGLLQDALWLRAESWKQAFRGTPLLCLAQLGGLFSLAVMLGVAIRGSVSAFWQNLYKERGKMIVAGLLVLLVMAALSSTAAVKGERHDGLIPWLRRKAFLAIKIALLVLSTFVLSEDICQPVSLVLPLTAEYLQIFFFVVLALLALRWTFFDQEQRCKHCLALLTAPARVGRPSHNLLEWNGTELVCKRGHGLLSIPELETSWRSSSESIYKRMAD